MWQQLFETLQNEDNLYRVIEKLIKYQQKHIVENKADAVEQANQKLAVCYEQSVLLEKKRKELIAEFAAEIDIKAEELTLNRITEYVPREYQPEYQKLVFSLIETVKRVQLENDRNKELLKMSLQYIDLSLNILASSGHSSYGAKGEEHDGERQNSFLNFQV